MKRPAGILSSFVVLHLAVLVASAQDRPEAPVERVVRSHDIRFLTEAVPQFPAPEWPEGRRIRLDASRAPDLAAGGVDILEVGFEDLPLTPGAGLSADAIVGLIRANVAEDTWANERNSIEASDRELVVVQTPEVQERIEELLAALRGRRARMVTVDLALVPAEAIADLDRAAPWLTAAALDAALARAGEAGHRLSLTAYNDQTVSAFDGRHRSALVDDEVNQTGVIPVVNPVVRTFPLGLTVEVRPRVIEGTDWLTLDVKLARLEVDGEVEKRETLFSELEIVPIVQESLDARLLVERGKTAIAGVFVERGDPESAREFAVLARARPVDVQEETPWEGGEPDAHQLRGYDVRFLLEAADRAGGAELEPELLLDLVRANVDPEAWRDDRADLQVDDGLLLVTARLPTHERVAAWLVDRIRERGRVVTVEVRELEGPLDAIVAIDAGAGADAALPADWRASEHGARLRQVFHGLARGLLGSRLGADGYRARTFVRDLETVSGGTGFVIQFMPDPIVDSAGSGFTLDATVSEAGDAERFVLDIELHRCLTAFERQATFVTPAELAPSAPPPGAAPPDEATGRGPDPRTRFTWLRYAIDLPSQERRSVVERSAVPAGRDVVLEARETADGGGRLVVARVTVSGAAAGNEAPSEPATLRRAMRLYPLDLVRPEPLSRPRSTPPVPALRGYPAVRDLDMEEAVGWIDFDDAGAEDPLSIVDLIEEFIDPDSWANSRNSVDVAGNRLAVVQTPQVLERIGAFLGRVEDHVGRTLLVELALVPPEVLDGLAPGWRRPGAPPWLAGDVLHRAVGAAGERARYAAARQGGGASVALSPTRMSLYVADHEVNQTGVLPTVNPVVGGVPEGTFAEVAAHLGPGGAWCRADVIVGDTGAPPELGERRRLPRGDIDLLRESQGRIETAVAGPLGRTLVLGSFSLPSGAGEGGGANETPPRFAALLRVRPLFDAAAGESGGDQPVFIDVGSLTAFAGSQRFGAPSSWDEDYGGSFFDQVEIEGDDTGPRPLVDRKLLETSLRRAMAGDRRAKLRFFDAGRSVILQGAADAVEAAIAHLVALARVRVRPVTIDLWQGSIEDGRLADLDAGNAVLGEEWLERFDNPAGVRARLAGLAGVVLSLHSVASRSFVRELQRVSGGTERTVLEASDPVVAAVGEGLALTALAALVPGTPWVQLRVQGELARPPTFGRQARIRENLSVELPGERDAPDEGGEPRAAGEWVAIDLPEENTERWEHMVTVPRGRPVLLNALPDPARPGRTVVLLAVVNGFTPDADER